MKTQSLKLSKIVTDAGTQIRARIDEEVVAHYNKGGTPHPQLDEDIFPLKLTAAEAADLVTFLKEGLASASYPAHTAPELPK